MQNIMNRLGILGFVVSTCVLVAPGCASNTDDEPETTDATNVGESEEALLPAIGFFVGGTTVAAGTAGGILMAGTLTIGGARYWLTKAVNGADYGGTFNPARTTVKNAEKVETKCPKSHFEGDHYDIVLSCVNYPGQCQGTRHAPCAGHHTNGRWLRFIPQGENCKLREIPAVKCDGPLRVVDCSGASVGRCGPTGSQVEGVWQKEGVRLQ